MPDLLSMYAGVHPDTDRARLVPAGANQVRFGDLRREAAEEALEAVQAGDAAEAARSTVDALRRREQTALGRLEELVLAEAPPEEVQAQAAKVQALHRELSESRVEMRDAEAVAQREQAQANRAARDLHDAEAGRPRLVVEQADRPTDLRDRLG